MFYAVSLFCLARNCFSCMDGTCQSMRPYSELVVCSGRVSAQTHFVWFLQLSQSNGNETKISLTDFKMFKQRQNLVVGLSQLAKLQSNHGNCMGVRNSCFYEDLETSQKSILPNFHQSFHEQSSWKTLWDRHWTNCSKIQ